MINSVYQKDYRNKKFPFNAGQFFQGISFMWHWHEEFEILECLSGTFTIGVENQFFTLGKDEFIIIPSKQMHCVLSSPATQHLALKFSPTLLANSYTDFTAFTSKNLCSPNWSTKDQTHVLEIISKIWQEHSAQKRGYQSAICQYLYELQTYVIRHCPQSASGIHISENDKPPLSPIHPVLLFISQHYKENLTLSACAKQFNFNTNYFSSYFANATGITFYKYLQTLRLREFEHLLITTDESITELCSKSGFASVKTLNRVFRNAWDMSPTEYRIKFKNSLQEYFS